MVPIKPILTFVLLRHFINTSRKPIAPENVTSETSSPHCGLCCMRLSISTPLLGNITVVVDWDVSGWLKCCDNSLRRRVHIASPTFRYRFWFFFNLFSIIWYQCTCGNCSIICFWKYSQLCFLSCLKKWSKQPIQLSKFCQRNTFWCQFEFEDAYLLGIYF